MNRAPPTRFMVHGSWLMVRPAASCMSGWLFKSSVVGTGRRPRADLRRQKLLYFSGGRMVLWGLHIVPGLGTSPFEMLGWGTTPSLTSMP